MPPPQRFYGDRNTSGRGMLKVARRVKGGRVAKTLGEMRFPKHHTNQPRPKRIHTCRTCSAWMGRGDSGYASQSILSSIKEEGTTSECLHSSCLAASGNQSVPSPTLPGLQFDAAQFAGV